LTASSGVGERAVWQISTYRDYLSENTRDRNVVGSAVVLAAIVLLIIMFA
jgi:hypothetical protein